MQPDPLTRRQRSIGKKQPNKTSNTVSVEDIPPENRATEGTHEGATEDSAVGGTEPSVRHPNRPERDKLGGNFNGPGKARARP